MVRRRLPLIGVLLLVLASLVGASAPAAALRPADRSRAQPRALPQLPAPGTASEIATLIGEAPHIQTLPATTLPTLPQAAGNRPSAYYPATYHGCLKATECVYGDTAATRSIVLFGDSHAVMWLPALDPIGKALGYRVVLLYLQACPAVKVTIYLAPGQDGPNVGYDKWCNIDRWTEIKEIRAMKPALVLLANKTFWDYSSPTTFFTAGHWKRGLQWTVGELRTAQTAVAVIGDIIYMNMSLPQCLAAFPSAIQRCGQASPNKSSHGNQAAEQAESKALGIAYINTNQWICSSWCSPVVGNMIVSLDQSHINAVYAEYLTNVMEAAVKPLLGPAATVP